VKAALPALLLLCSGFSFAQFPDTLSRAEMVQFVNYLVNEGQADDAVYLLSRYRQTHADDSLAVCQARLMMGAGRYSEADSILKRVITGDEAVKRKKVLLLNHANLLLGRHDSVSHPPCAGDSLCTSLFRIQALAGMLLKKNHEAFELLFAEKGASDPILSFTEYNLYVYHSQSAASDRRSPFLAGLISAILPGAGKLYAGKPHEALHTLLPVLFNAAQSAEGYYHGQLRSLHFYVFGSATLFFYSANIAGSVRAAKRKNTENEDRIRLRTENELSKLLKYY
jgi:hypothetical protein